MTTPRFDILGQAISDASRTRMLCELMEGRAYTNKELASAAGVTPQTATAHLRLLQQAGLVIAQKSGRCVYHRLASAEVARALEQLAAITPIDSLYRAQQRKAGQLSVLRSCYDHLAGPLAVQMTQAFLARGLLVDDNGGYRAIAHATWDRLGVTLPEYPGPRPFVRPCLDWTERRPHVAGPLGQQLLTHCLEAGWVRRSRTRRGLVLTSIGAGALAGLLGLSAADLAGTAPVPVC